MKYKICDVLFEFDFLNGAFFEPKFLPYLSLESHLSAKYKIRVKEKNLEDLFPDKNYINYMESSKAKKYFYEHYFIIVLLKRGEIMASIRCENREYEVQINKTSVDSQSLEYKILTNLFFEIMNLECKAVIHGSAIQYHNQGILFSGPSGSGKSTQSSIWKRIHPFEVTYINDDKPVLSYEGEQLFLYGNPFSGKMNLHTNLKVPLRAIFFVVKSEQNFLRELTSLEKIKFMMENLGNLNQSQKNRILLDYCERSVSSIPMYELNCRISDETYHLVKEKILPL